MVRPLRGSTPWPSHWRRERLDPRTWIIEGHTLRQKSATWEMQCPTEPDNRIRMGMNLRGMIPDLTEHLAECAPASAKPTLPPISADRYRFTFDEPMFTRMDGEWFLIGPESTLPVGEVVSVHRYHSGRGAAASDVRVGEIVADRVVYHRPGSYTHTTRGVDSTRYVLARIDKEGLS